MRFRKCLLVVAMLSSSNFARAEETDAFAKRLQPSIEALSQDWTNVRSSIRAKTLSNDEKSAMIDAFFDHLANSITHDGQDLVSMFLNKLKAEQTNSADKEVVDLEKTLTRGKTWVDTQYAEITKDLDEDSKKTIVDAKEKLDGFYLKLRDQVLEEAEKKTNETAKSQETLDRFIQKTRDVNWVPRANLALELLRDVLRLEEDHLLTLINEGSSSVDRIEASAQIARDMVFISRQISGLIRVTYTLSNATVKFSAARKARTSGAEWQAYLDQVLPAIVRSANDLGVYHAKILQSLSGLVQLVDPVAYAQLDFLQGQLPQRMTYDQVKTVIEKDLNQPINEIYKTFEREPFANGSMAQVHWATIAGAKNQPDVRVAVKIRRDSAVEELAWNTKTNELIYKFLESLVDKDMEPIVKLATSQARELGVSFQSEFDFPAEAQRQKLFRRLLIPIKNLEVPQVVLTKSGARVITSLAVENSRRIHKVLPQTGKRIFELAAKEPSASKPSEPTINPDEAAEAAKDKEDDSESSDDTFPKLISKLMLDYGFKVNPRYLQLMRSSVPAFTVFFSLVKEASRLEKERSKDDPEVVSLKKTARTLISGFLYQAFYIKELHADYNYGNLLVDDENDLHVIDWGQTVETRGLLSQPIILGLAAVKGDAKLIVKKLAQIGSFSDLKRDRKAIVASVQSLLDEEEIKKQSWFSLTRSIFSGENKLKGKFKSGADAARKDFKDGVVANDETVAAPTKAVDSATAAPVVENVAPAAEPAATAKKPKGIELVKQVGGPLVKVIAGYPYHRVRVRAIKATVGLQEACGRLLNY